MDYRSLGASERLKDDPRRRRSFKRERWRQASEKEQWRERERERGMPTKRSGLKAFGKRGRWNRAWFRDS